MSGGASRPGIALPVALLVLVALSLVSVLAIDEALAAGRVAALADDAVRARAALIEGADGLSRPPDVAALCLRPPTAPEERRQVLADGTILRWRWWHVAPGIVRVELAARAREGARARRVGWMRPDTVVATGPSIGCPGATHLQPLTDAWIGPHPEG